VKDISTNEVFALKITKDEKEEPNAMKSFKREKDVYEALKESKHPSFPVYLKSAEEAKCYMDDNQIKERAVLQVEFVDGINLFDFVCA